MCSIKNVHWITAALICWSALASAETLDRIVATVNGDIILYSELQQNIHFLEKISPEIKTSDPARQAQIERDILKQMIQDKLTQEEIKRLKITVSQREVDAAIENIKAENRVSDAQLQALIQQEGQTIDQFRDNIRKQIERTRLMERALKSKIVITDQQIDEYLQSAKGMSKELRRIGVIFIPAQEEKGSRRTQDPEQLAMKIYGQLKDGADFSSLAKEHSKGPAANDGGDIGFISLEELAPPIAAAVRGIRVNEITDVIKSGGGYYIVKLLEVKQEKQDAADSDVREKVRRQLYQQELNRRFEEWVRDLESRAFIQITL